MTNSDFANYLVAAATFVATAAALFLGWRADTKSSRDEMNRARLVAARISLRLEASAESLRQAYSLLFEDLDVDTGAGQIATFKRLATLVQESRFEPEPSDLLALTALPENCASQIGSAFGLLEATRRQLEEVNMVTFSIATLELNEIRLNRWIRQVCSAADRLQIASRVCSEAAWLGAPQPSAEALYERCDDGKTYRFARMKSFKTGK